MPRRSRGEKSVPAPGTVSAEAGASASLSRVAFDGHDRLRTSDALRRQSEFTYTLVQAAPVPIIATDTEWTIVLWNPAAERLFGWRADEVLGRVPPFVPDGKLEESETIARRLRRGEAVVEFATRRLRKDGTPLDVRLTVSPLLDNTGRLTGCVIVVENITDQCRAEAEVRQRIALMDQLLAASAGLSRMTTTSDAIETIGLQAMRLASARSVTVLIPKPGGEYRHAWSRGISSAYLDALRAHRLETPYAHVPAALQPLEIEPERGTPEDAILYLYPDTRRLPEGSLRARLAEIGGYRAAAIWRLTYAGRKLGVIGCHYDEPRTWSKAEQEAFHAFGRQAAVTLENTRLREEQSERTAELEALFVLSGHLRAARRPEEMYPIIVSEAIRILGTDAGRLAALTEDRRELEVVASSGHPAIAAVGHRFPVDGSTSGHVIASGTPFVAADCAQSAHMINQAHRETFGPAVIVPVRTEYESVGTLAVYRKREGAAGAFTAAEVRTLQGLAEMGGTAIRRARLYRDLEDSYIEMVLTLARTLDARDAYTSGHSERMAEWAERVARMLGQSHDDTRTVRWGALLHDIGKLGVPDEVLRKPGALTPAEWDVMRRHPAIGEGILRSAERMRPVAQIVRSHQERWDGTGYPDGLAGEEIPLGARIVAVVDAYGAMIDDRLYRPARSPEEALAELRRGAGTQFDPRIVETFCGVAEAWNATGSAVSGSANGN